MVPLSPQQIQTFFEVGYLLVPDVFSPEEVQQMRAAFDRLAALAQTLPATGDLKGSRFVIGRKDGKLSIHRINWCGAAEAVLDKFGRDRRIVGLAAQLLGSKEMNQLICQAHFKSPGDGVYFPWHQDIQHRDKYPGAWRDVNGKGSYIQTATAVDDSTRENGPLLFIPGTGKIGRLPLTVGGEEDEYSHMPEHPELFDPAKAVPALMKSGSVVLFGPYTIHGSEPNRSPNSRRAFINGYAYPGANSMTYPGEGAGRLISSESP
jgi:ectoine hydroxylase-related dioxygenase (phytanoyl-CoA dioxygenase family)